MSIPKILIQTSRDPLPEYVTHMIQDKLPAGWHYQHFNHEQREQWLQLNAHQLFPDIMSVYHRLPTGAHQSDLFRYYFLYLTGGMYLDSDAMLEQHADQIIRDADLVVVVNQHGSTFNGFIAAEPGHAMLLAALTDVYNTDPNYLRHDYLLFCRNLYNMISVHSTSRTRILMEDQVTAEGWGSFAGSECVVMHYPNTKIIPQR